MRKILLITHGDFGKSLLEVATIFFGANENFKSLEFNENMEIIHLENQVLNEIDEQDSLKILCLVDIKGGTPYNVAKKISLINEDVEVCSGLNLGMILQLIMQPGSSFDDVKNAAIESIGG